jgi:hypothetical protein
LQLRLIRIIGHEGVLVGCGLFACPPGAAKGEFPGQRLFAGFQLPTSLAAVTAACPEALRLWNRL